MSNAYLDPGPHRAAKVRQLFSRIAARYDLLNDLQSFGLHRAWKRALARRSGARPGLRALDLCCGTGDIARRLAVCGAWTVGLDFAWPMLLQSTPRAAGDRSTGWRAVQGDALRLPFRSESFDVAAMSYGLRNLADRTAAFAEVHRVLKRGGHFLILDFGKPRGRVGRALYFFYLKKIVPQLGKWLAGDAQAYAYIVASLRHYPEAEQISGELAEFQFNVTARGFFGGAMTLHQAWKRAA